MRRNIALSLVLPLLTLSACSDGQKSEKPMLMKTQEYLMGSTLYTQQSGEYRALCFQAYNTAKSRLLEKVATGIENPAVILDLDETVLDNSPYTAWMVAENMAFSDSTWDAWVRLKSAEIVPGADSFLRFADSLGVAIFYVSNRGDSQLEPTRQNMITLGLPQTDSAHYYLKTTTSDKEERRKSVAALGYNVVIWIGDNLGDFKSDWDKPASTDSRRELTNRHHANFGMEYIVLPNALYGTWEGALYEYDRSLSDSQRDSLRHKNLILPNGW